MRKEDEAAAGCELYAGAFAWELRNVCRIKPFPVRGQLRIFDVEPPTVVFPPHQSLLKYPDTPAERAGKGKITR
jgi:hypothetical protein